MTDISIPRIIMTYIWCALVMCLCAQVTDCRPTGKQSHVEDTERPCQKVANALGTVLRKAGRVFYLQQGALEEAVNTLSVIDLFDPSERERVACSLQGIATLSELMDAATTFRLDYNTVKVVYDYISFSLRSEKYTIETTIELSNATEAENRKIVGLIQNLEAFGLIGLDPIGEAAIGTWFMPINLTDAQVEPPSLLPRDEQCLQLTDSVQKVWNVMTNRAKGYNTAASEEYRSALTRWTGIALTDHERVKIMACDLLGRVDGDGLAGIYNWTKDNLILNRVLKTGYPYIQDAFANLYLELSNTTEVPGEYEYHYTAYYATTGIRQIEDIDNDYYDDVQDLGNYEYGYGDSENTVPSDGSPGQYVPSFSGPRYWDHPRHEDVSDLHENARIILDNLELMGLMSLEDDLTP